MDRKAILRALKAAGQLDAEAAVAVRGGDDQGVRSFLIDIGACPAALSAAGLHVPSDECATMAEIEDMASLHMMAIGMEPLPVAVLDLRIAERIELDREWQLLLNDVTSDPIGMPGRVARIVKMMDDAAWQPLVWLIERGVWPFGPSPAAGAFVVSGPGLFPEPPKFEGEE